jgi:hypothetical protein
MSRAAEISLAFGGEERLFRLPLGRLRALQEKCDCGPMELLRRFLAGEWRVDDLRETIFQGLVGGGMDQGAATSLLKSSFDDLPLQPFVTIAQAIVMAAVVGAEDEDLGEPKGEAEPSAPSPSASSASAPSTAPEPSSDTPPGK